MNMSDPCSFSSFTRCLTKHLNLLLHVDFDTHVIRGKVELTVEALEDRFSVLVTDRFGRVLTPYSGQSNEAKIRDNLHGVWCELH